MAEKVKQKKAPTKRIILIVTINIHVGRTPSKLSRCEAGVNKVTY